MAGTAVGGKKAAATIKNRDPDFYAKIGSEGGKKKVPKGFARMTPEKRSAAGKVGGAKSRRTRRIDTSQQNATTDSSSDSSTTKPGQKPANDTKQANVKPSPKMSSFLGRFKGAWRG